MTNLFNSSQKFNELIFESKNKAYGAYALRSSQNNTIAKSMFITFLGICALVLCSFVSNKKNVDDNIIIPIDTSYVLQIDLTEQFKEIPLQIEKPIQEKKVAYSDNNNYVVDDHAVIDPLKVNADLVIKKDGDPKGDIDSSERKEPVVILPPSPPLPPEPPSIIVTEMPELKNMNQFISDNLRYPVIAKENGTSGTVFLSFVVEKDGSVSDVKILKGVGDGCAEEAMRVVKMMPKWKPGRNHGELVRVQFNLPIRFRLQ